MGWEDRPYYRDHDDTSRNRLLWVLNGSVPLFTVFGIRVRMHASLILTILLVLIFGLGKGFTWQDRVQSMVILFVVVLLHEFGHCFAARWMGGSADEVLMTPLGGLAMAHAPRRWWPNLVTVAAGPAVNVIICVGCGALLWALTATVPWNPFRLGPLTGRVFSWIDPSYYLFWTFVISLSLLLFNLLPIFPLDGGQMLQSVLWWKFGYYKATIWACVVGMVGSVLLLMAAIPTFSIMLGLIAVSCFVTCMTMRWQTLANGPEEYADSTDYSAAYEPATPRRKSRVSRRAIVKARRAVQEARLEQIRIDQILAKVSAHGIASLSWSERRALRKATEHRRKRDLELSQ